MVRCFIGIFIPDSLKPKILEIQNLIKSPYVDYKLVEVENLHLTLSFLGEVEDTRVPDIKDELDRICSNFKKFNISIAGIKFIPNEKYIRVIVLDAFDNLGTLLEISKEIKFCIGGDAKPPHLTLCRIKKINKDVVSKLQNIDSYCGGFQIASVQLIESRLSRSGPVYNILHEAKLL